MKEHNLKEQLTEIDFIDLKSFILRTTKIKRKKCVYKMYCINPHIHTYYFLL